MVGSRIESSMWRRQDSDNINFWPGSTSGFAVSNAHWFEPRACRFGRTVVLWKDKLRCTARLYLNIYDPVTSGCSSSDLEQFADKLAQIRVTCECWISTCGHQPRYLIYRSFMPDKLTSASLGEKSIAITSSSIRAHYKCTRLGATSRKV